MMRTLRPLVALVLAGTPVAAQEPGRFREVEIDKAFAPYLLSSPLLMEIAGAKVIRLRSGNQLVIGVGATPIGDGSAKDRLRAELVCRSKALASIVAEKEGVTVAHVERLREKTVVVIQDGKEKARSVSDLLQVTQSQASGIARGMAVVGRWKSADGQIFYLALAVLCDKSGNVLSGAAPR